MMNRRATILSFVVTFMATVVLCWVTIPSQVLCAERARLELIRENSENNYSSLVFMLNTPAKIESPTQIGTNLAIKFRDVTSSLTPFYRYSDQDTWILLEEDEKDLNVTIGLPPDFERFSSFALQDPFRLVVNLYRGRKTRMVEQPRMTMPVILAKPEANSASTFFSEASAAPHRDFMPNPETHTVPETTYKTTTSHKPERTTETRTASELELTGELEQPDVKEEPDEREIDEQKRLAELKLTAEKERLAEQQRIAELERAEELKRAAELRQAAEQKLAARQKQATETKETKIGDFATLNFHEVDVRELLTALAMKQKANIVVGSDIKGKISLHLYDASLSEALDAVTIAAGLEYTKHGATYYVYKPKEVKDPEASRLQMRMFKLKYGEVKQTQEALDAIPGKRTVKVHIPSKTIIVEDTPENLKKIAEVIRFWDQMPKQVIIEAKIIKVTLTDEMSLGVNWEQMLGDANIGTGGLSSAVTQSETTLSPIPATGQGIFGNILTGAASSRKFTAALDALQTKTKIETLSAPKILAVHGVPASVQVGGKQGYETSVTNEGVTAKKIEFIDTGTMLRITPYVDDEDNILLEVSPEINSVKITGGIPTVATTTVTTRLLAQTGKTAFIAGLIENEGVKTRQAVPCFGSIPGLGALFRKTSRSAGKSEVVILITPTVVPQSSWGANPATIQKVEEMESELGEIPRSPIRELLLPDK